MTLASRWRPGFDPFGEARRLHDEIDRLFGQRPIATGGTFPAVNLWTGPESVAVTAELPGVAPEDVDISVKDDVLSIRGERKAPAIDGEAGWHRRERAYGSFQRMIQLPFRVDPDRVDARFRNGVLEVDLHRPEEDKPRRIQVQS